MATRPPDGEDVFQVPPAFEEEAGAFRYSIAPNTADSHQHDPYWIAVIIPFAFKDTYDRRTQKPVSRPPVFELEKIIIDNDCINWNCSSSKGSHTSSLSMTLLPTMVDYTSKVAPEDWILFWAFSDYASYKRIKELIESNSRCNDFKSGLKFVGKVQTVFKTKNVEPTSGRKTVNYNLTASGFTELDATMYFDQNIELLRPNAAVYWSNFAEVANKFTKQQGGLIKGEEAIPFLLSVCFGCGPSAGAKTGGLDGGRSMTPNEAFLVPESILNFLGPPQPEPFFKNVGFTYVDLLKVFIGTFQYNTAGFHPAVKSSEAFMSFGTKPISGVFGLQPLNFNNQSVWSIIKTYSGEPMNETFTCLRTNKEDSGEFIYPTVIFRQLPFSSPQFISENSGTSFLSLPRWVIDEKMISSIQYGQSNALRFNYMHIVPTNWANNDPAGKALANFLGDPIADVTDIKRAGLRAKIETIGATFEASDKDDAQKVNQFYNRLMADILFGGHLKYTGTISCKGIQEPICEGDNCQADGIIFHIERVMHQGSIDAFGRKEFNTTLHVVNGVLRESDDQGEFVIPEDQPIATDVGNTFEVE